MGSPAPMPRWHDLPILWLGLQAIVFAGYVALIQWMFADLQDVTRGVLIGVGLAAIVIGAAWWKARLVRRDDPNVR